MKKSKALVTLIASTTIMLSLVSTALAAPAASNGYYPTNHFLRQLPGSSGSSRTSQPSRSGIAPAPTATAAPAPTPAPAATKAPAPIAAPATGSTPGTVTPVTGSMSADESNMINLVNQDRASNGFKPLTFDSGLRAGALAHSQDMSASNYFSHTSPTQGDFAARIKASGVKFSAAGENIAEYASVEAAETGFMNSPGHRANILGDFTRVGIGIVNKNGTYIITQWFAK